MAEQSEFLPFNAINNYMRPDFRLSVIRETLNGLASLPEELSNELNAHIKKNVKIPGFRSSDKAPALVKVVPTSKAFEKNPELVAALLSCWSEIQIRLRGEVYSILESRNWKTLSTDEITPELTDFSTVIKEWPIFPVTMDRAKLPGFYSHWPKGEDFEVIYSSYTEKYPDSDASIDKVSLMAVWLAMRLPFQVDDTVAQQDELPVQNLES
jgi:hypothetical protein